MKKIKCSNCRTLNFEKVRICSNCRKAVSQSAGFTGHKNPNKTQFAKVGKIILNVLLLMGLGVGGFFGYQKYSEWSEEQRKIEIAKQEKQEITNFLEVNFEVDKYKYDRVDRLSFSENVMKIPKPFRIEPPELMILNTFPYSEKTTKKIDPKSLGKSSTTINTGSRLETLTTEKFTDPKEYKMSKVAKILGYKYSKNSIKELVCEVQVEAEILYSVFSNEEWKKQNNAPHSGKGKIILIRRNNKWELSAINISSGTGADISWYAETDHLVNKSQ